MRTDIPALPEAEMNEDILTLSSTVRWWRRRWTALYEPIKQAADSDTRTGGRVPGGAVSSLAGIGIFFRGSMMLSLAAAYVYRRS